MKVKRNQEDGCIEATRKGDKVQGAGAADRMEILLNNGVKRPARIDPIEYLD
jgi:hypothetical protein